MESEGVDVEQHYLPQYSSPSRYNSKAADQPLKPSPVNQTNGGATRGAERDYPPRTAVFNNSTGQQPGARPSSDVAVGGKDKMHRVLLLGWKPLVDVYCNGLTGKFIGGHERDLYIQCTGPGYDHLPLTALEENGCIMTCSQFEKKAGRELSKKWKESIHVVGEGEGSKATLIAWLKRRAADQFGEAVVGKECWVCWCADGDFYRGTIIGYSSESGKHKVRYSDRFVEELHLPAELLDLNEDKPRVPTLKDSNFKLPSSRQTSQQAPVVWNYNVPGAMSGQGPIPSQPGSAQKAKPPMGAAERATPKKQTGALHKPESPLSQVKKAAASRNDADPSPLRQRADAGGATMRASSSQRTTSDEDPYKRPRPVVPGSRRRGRPMAADQGEEDGASDGTASDENVTPRKAPRTGDMQTPGRSRASTTPQHHMHPPLPEARHSGMLHPGLSPAPARATGSMEKRMPTSDLRRANGHDIALLAQQPQSAHAGLAALLNALGDASWPDTYAHPPQSILPPPPQRGYDEANPVVISKWMNDMILELEEVLEGYQPDDEEGGPRMSARFQMLLVQSRNTDQFRGFYDAMLARYYKHQNNPDLLQSKLAEFIVGCLHQYDVMAQAQANVAQAAAASAKSVGK